MVTLGAELDVECNYDCLADSDGKEESDDAEEAEDIVIGGLVEVESFKDEEEFDKEDGKWDQASEEREDELVARVPGCIFGRDLTRNGARAGWMSVRF